MDSLLWYDYDLSNQRDFVKCIRQLEKVCRDTLEYDEWQKKCKYKDNKICPVCDDNYYEVNSKIESHHHPKTLWTIVEEIVEAHMTANTLDSKTGLQITQEVMDLHLLNQVHYINLCVHCHKKFHSGHPQTVEKINIIFKKREVK